MKKILSIVFLALACFGLVLNRPALANAASPNAAAGAAVFASTCNACHIGGKNVLVANKTLSRADLEANGKFSQEAIVTQVTKGNGAMPSFARLGPDKIADVAAYVLDKATNGW